MKEHDSDRSETAGSTGADTLGERVAGMGRDAASAAKHQADTLLTGAKHGTARAASEASDATDTLAESLAGSGQENLSRVAGALSSRLEKFAVYLEERSFNDLARDAQRIAQRNPGLFIAGGLALGFALSRFFKASRAVGPVRTSRTH